MVTSFLFFSPPAITSPSLPSIPVNLPSVPINPIQFESQRGIPTGGVRALRDGQGLPHLVADCFCDLRPHRLCCLNSAFYHEVLRTSSRRGGEEEEVCDEGKGEEVGGEAQIRGGHRQAEGGGGEGEEEVGGRPISSGYAFPCEASELKLISTEAYSSPIQPLDILADRPPEKKFEWAKRLLAKYGSLVSVLSLVGIFIYLVASPSKSGGTKGSKKRR